MTVVCIIIAALLLLAMLFQMFQLGRINQDIRVLDKLTPLLDAGIKRHKTHEERMAYLDAHQDFLDVMKTL